MVSIDVDIDEVYWAMSNREKEEMYNNLINDGYGDSFDDEFGFKEPPVNLVEWEFQEIIEKIALNRLRLSNEDDEILRQIASKL